MKNLMNNLSKVAASFSINDRVLISNSTIIADNLIVRYEAKHGIQVVGSGVVNFKELQNLFKARKSIEKIEFFGNNCYVTAGGATFSIIANEPLAFPEKKIPVEAIEIVSESFNFGREWKLAQTFVAPKSDLRDNLRSVYISAQYICATDGKKMYFPMHNQKFDGNIIMPKESFLICGTYKVESFHIEKVPYLLLTNSDETITVKTVDEIYPDFLSVVPKNSPNISTFNKLQFRAKIEAALLMANKDAKSVDLMPDSIQSCCIMSGTEYKENIIQDVRKGEAADLTFNGKYMLECLKAIESDTFELKTSAPNKAMILGDHILLMPIKRITW